MSEATQNTRLTKALNCKANEIPAHRFLIPIMNRDNKHIGTLACVDRDLASNMDVISALTNWRRQYMHYFLTQFEVSDPRTKLWLENIVIPSHDRIFFVILLTNGDLIGNSGICNMTNTSGELDNLIRGRKGGDPKLIYYSEIALLSWMFGYLDYKMSNLHVFSNNIPTIKLHSSVGFKISDTIKLTKRKSPDLVEHLLNSDKGDSVDYSYLEMSLYRDKFLELHPWVHNIYIDYWK